MHVALKAVRQHLRVMMEPSDRLVPSDGGSQELTLCWADSLDCANY
jgi:hypothetical protein